jgi:hypothetical protein
MKRAETCPYDATAKQGLYRPKGVACYCQHKSITARKGSIKPVSERMKVDECPINKNERGK